jgi:hypothetical protein
VLTLKETTAISRITKSKVKRERRKKERWGKEAEQKSIIELRSSGILILAVPMFDVSDSESLCAGI